MRKPKIKKKHCMICLTAAFFLLIFFFLASEGGQLTLGINHEAIFIKPLYLRFVICKQNLGFMISLGTKTDRMTSSELA